MFFNKVLNSWIFEKIDRLISQFHNHIHLYFYRHLLDLRLISAELKVLAIEFCNRSRSTFQKQPPRGVPRKSCSENMQQIYRRTPMPKCDFNKVVLQLRHGCSPVNLFHIFRTPFSKNTFGGLLLTFKILSMFLSKLFRSSFVH